jgi:hypothetical protein
MPKIPNPEYFSERVNGVLIAVEGGLALVAGQDVNADPVYRGEIVLRYGIAFQAPAHPPIIPGLFVSEKGAALVGREAWDTMETRFQMFPRADIVGVSPDGTPRQVFLRELDFGVSPRVFAYAPDDKLLGEVIALVGSGDAAGSVPELLAKYARRVDSLHDLSSGEGNYGSTPTASDGE